MDDVTDSLTHHIEQTKTYYSWLLAGHLLFWVGVGAITGRVLFLDLMSQLSGWPILFIFSGVGMLWWGHHKDSE